ncbi:MAG: SIR2 family protein [Acidobacteriota bacterium]|nr:SIR2 family protein [Acidobacteriota bacterium]
MSNRISDHDAELIRRADDLLKNEYDQNSEFNDALNGVEPLEIRSIHDHDVIYRLEPSEALFWADRVTYNDELTTWTEQQLAGKHKEALDLLEKNDQIGLFREMTDAIRRNRIVPFVGAGMSFESNFPLWGQALKTIMNKIDGVEKNVFQDALDKGDYLLAAELLWNADETQVKGVIRSKFAKSCIPTNGPLGAVNLLGEISRGCIVTTNYDRIIETVIPSLDGYMHGRQEGHNFIPNLVRGERCLLKLHGDADNSDSYVFTRSQYEEAYGTPFDFGRPLPKALRQIFIGHSLLFLGCSLVQDRTLELFEEVIDNRNFEVPDHYAILSEPDGDETRNQKENRLLKTRILPIWYPAGEHQYVGNLLRLAIDVARGIIQL